MNSKMLLAFVGGLIVASGVTYIAMKRNSPAPVETAKSSVAAPVEAPSASPPPAVDEPAAAPAPEETKPAPEPAKPKTKPSPSVRPKEHVVRSSPEPAPAASTPAPATPPAQQPQPQPEPPKEVAKAELPQPPPYIPPPPQPHTVTIPLGTNLTVRLGERLSTDRNQPGDQFSAVLDQPLVFDGFVIAEKGAQARGRIVELDRGGKVKGTAHLAIELTHLKTSDGQNVRINTAAFSRHADTTHSKDAAKVGIGAAIGAAIGAMAGGGKGAGIGAGVGGAAGAGDVLMTRGQPAEIPIESRLSFRLSEPLTLTEQLR